VGRWGDGVRRVLTAPLRALLPRHPLWRALVIALPVLVLLFFLEPAVNLVVKLIDLFLRIVDPLLQTTVGRLVLLVAAFVLGGMTTAWLLRSRIRTFRGRVQLGRHLQGTAALLGNDRRQSRAQFARVCKRKHVKPAEYPALVQDANLKLARLALEEGHLDEALRCLTRIVEPGLPRELRRSLLQLRVQALRLQPGTLPETLEQEVRTAIDEFADDGVLQHELRRCLMHRGDLLGAAEAQARVHKLAPPARQAAERQTLIDDLCAAGRAALQQGDRESARKVHKRLDKLGGAAAGMLHGEILLRDGDVRAAVRAFGQTRTPEGLDRVAEVLAEHPGAMDLRELLECCPLQGTLLLVARDLARQGQHEQARRAAQKAAEALGPTPTVCSVLAEVLSLLGKPQEAQLLAEQAVRRLLAPPPTSAT